MVVASRREMAFSKTIIPKKGARTLRTGRRSIPGRIYHLTTVTFERKPIFRNSGAAKIVLDSLNYLENHGVIILEAAVIMPDHVHVVAGLISGTLAQVMQRFKSFTAKQINKALHRDGPVWNPQYHDHAIRRDEVLLEVIQYCLHNPVRAGLVDDFHQYPHWYCRYGV